MKIDKIITDRNNVLPGIEYENNARRYNIDLAFKNWEFSTNIPGEEKTRKLEICDEFINKLSGLNYNDFRLIVLTLEVNNKDYELTKIEVYDNRDKLVCKISRNDK